jgi:hypothetical protein
MGKTPLARFDEQMTRLKRRGSPGRPNAGDVATGVAE